MRLLSPLPSIFLALLVLATACGPAFLGLGFGAASSRSGGSNAVPMPTISVKLLGSFGNTGLVREFAIDVNMDGILIDYRLNQENWIPVAQTRTRGATVRILMEAGRINTLTVRASFGQQSATTTRTFDDSQKNTRSLYLEPIAFTGNNATLVWSQYPSASRPIKSFQIFYGTTPTPNIRSLDGTSAAQGASGLSLAAASLRKTNGRYTYQLTGLLTGSNKAMKYYYFGIVGSDGSTSPIVSAHTDPRPQAVTWVEHASPQTIAIPPQHDRCAPILVDRGDYTGSVFSKHRGPDGLKDIVIVNKESHLYTIGNGGKIGGFTAPTLSKDTPREIPIQAHGIDIDRDLLPDVMLATWTKIYSLQGDPNRGLGFKYDSTNKPLTIPAGNPRNAVFLEMSPGDFDGDGIWDIAASVGTLPTSTTGFGTSTAIYIWYGTADGDYYQNNIMGQFELPLYGGKPRGAGTVIRIDTKFAHDSGFVVDDINRDGIDDIVHSRSERQNGFDLTVHTVELMQGRNTRPKTIKSSPNTTVLHNDEHVNERNTVFTDIDSDGYPDMLILRTINQELGHVAIVAYKNTKGTGTFQTTGQPALYIYLGPTHRGKARKDRPDQRGFMRILDLNRDGLLDIAFRRIWNGSVPVSQIEVFFGSRDPRSGLQDWKTFSLGARFGFATGKQPGETTINLQFSAADLNHDGYPDFCVVHNKESGGTTGTVRFLMSQPGPEFTKDNELLDFSGEIGTPRNAERAEFAMFQGKGDIFLGMQETSGVVSVSYLPAALANGETTGGYRAGASIPVVGLSAIPFSVSRSALNADPLTDLLVYRKNGRVGHLRYDASQNQFTWHDSEVVTLLQPAIPIFKVFPATFDRDAFGDGLVWLSYSQGDTVSILSTAPNAKSSTRNLKVLFANLALERQPVESVFVKDVTGDGLDDVIVVYKPSSGQRVMWVYKVRLEKKSFHPTFSLFETVKNIKVPAPLLSLLAINTTATIGINSHLNQTLIAGSTEGRIISFAPGNRRKLKYGDWEDGKILMTIGTGTMDISLADINYDKLPDLIVRSSDGQLHELLGFPLLRNTGFKRTHPWLTIGQGRFANQPSQRINLGSQPFFQASGQANDDPFEDLVILQATGVFAGRQLTFWNGRGSQQ